MRICRERGIELDREIVFGHAGTGGDGDARSMLRHDAGMEEVGLARPTTRDIGAPVRLGMWRSGIHSAAVRRFRSWPLGRRVATSACRRRRGGSLWTAASTRAARVGSLSIRPMAAWRGLLWGCQRVGRHAVSRPWGEIRSNASLGECPNSRVCLLSRGPSADALHQAA